MAKYIFILLLVMIGFNSFGQEPSGFPVPNAPTGYYKIGNIQPTRTLGIPKRDTTYTPSYDGQIVMRPQDKLLYYYDSASIHWRQVGTGSGGGNTNSNIGSGYRWAVPNTNNIKTIFPGFGFLIDSTTNTNALTAKPDSTKFATVTSLRDSLLAHPIIYVDSVQYIHSGAEADSITLATLAGKTVIVASIHPFSLYLTTTYAGLATDEVYVNNATGGVKFGTALQAGQKVTFVYKVSTTSGTPVVTGVQTNGGPTQTGIVPLTIPSQFNPIAGTNVTITGTYPNMTFNSSGGGGGSSPKAGKSIRISGTDTVNNRVDVADSSYAVLAGVIRGLWDTATNQNTWFWIANTDHGNINIKDSVVTSSSVVSVFYDSSTYQKVVTFLIVPDETASRIAQSMASFQGKANALFYTNGGYTAGASVGLTSASITFSKLLGLSVQVTWNGSAWVMSHPFNTAINFNSTPPTITYSAGRLRIQNLPFNMRENPMVMQYAINGLDSMVGYKPSIEVISSTWVDIYFWDSKNGVKYTAATPPTNFGVYLNFGTTWATLNPVTEDMGFNSNWWVIAILKKSLNCPAVILPLNTAIPLLFCLIVIILCFVRRVPKKLLTILVLIPVIASAQTGIISRSKTITLSGTTGLGMYSGNTAQRPTGNIRWVRWNTDSAALEVKIDASNWLKVGTGSSGGGGITTLNTLTAATQTFAVGTSGTDFAISSATSTHTFNLPTASASNRGALSTTDWSAFNAKIAPADTAAITNRSWRTAGNTAGAATFNLGTLDNNNWNFLANGAIVGRVTSTGQFLWNSTTNLSNNYKMQIRTPTIIFATPTGQNEFSIDDDGANNALATAVINTSGTNNRSLILTTLSANSFEVRQYGTTTVLFSIGANAGATNPGAPLTHLYTDAAITGRKYGFGAYNTVTFTGGDARRYAYEDSSVLNHSVSTGIYGSFYAHPSITASQGTDFGFRNDVLNNFFNFTSGNSAFGLTTAPTAKVHVSGTVKLDAMLVGGVASPILVKDADSVIRQVAQSALTGTPNIGNTNLTLSGTRTLAGATNTLQLGTSGSKISTLTVNTSSAFTVNSDANIKLFGGLILKQVATSDADYSVGITDIAVRLKPITANRTLTFGSPGTDTGRVLILINQNNTSNLWLTSDLIYNSLGAGVQQLDNGTTYFLQWVGDGTSGKWTIAGMWGTPPTIGTSGASVTMAFNTWNECSYNYQGGGASTFTLPQIAATRFGFKYYVKNAGGGSITLGAFGGSNDIYDSGSVSSITIAPGAARLLILMNSIWFVQ